MEGWVFLLPRYFHIFSIQRYSIIRNEINVDNYFQFCNFYVENVANEAKKTSFFYLKYLATSIAISLLLLPI